MMPLLGFDANNNKKYFLCNPKTPKIYLLVTNRALVTYMTEHGDYAPAQALMMQPM
jgi:hypothetical protein